MIGIVFLALVLVFVAGAVLGANLGATRARLAYPRWIDVHMIGDGGGDRTARWGQWVYRGPVDPMRPVWIPPVSPSARILYLTIRRTEPGPIPPEEEDR